MSGNVVGEGAILIKADDTAYKKGIESLKGQFQGFGNSVQSSFKQATEGVRSQFDMLNGSLEGLLSHWKGLLGAGIAGFGVKKLWDWTTDLATGAAKAYDDLNDLAAMIGVSSDKIYQLKYAVGSLGEDWGNVLQALGLFARNIGQAAEGDERAAEAFRKLGVEVKDANGEIRSTEAVLLDVAKAMEAMADGPAKVSAAMEVAGRGGRALIPILNEGADSIKELIRLAESRGYVLKPEAAKQAQEYLGSVNQLKLAFDSLWEGIGQELQPTLIELNKTFSQWVEENKEWLKQDLAGALKGVINLFGGLASAITWAWEQARPTLEFFSDAIGGILKGYEGLVNTIKNAASWIPGMGEEFEVVGARGFGWLDPSGKMDQVMREFRQRKNANWAEEEWQRAFGGGHRSIDPFRIEEVYTESKKGASGFGDQLAKVNRELEKQIPLMNLNYEALQRMGDAFRQNIVGPGGAMVSQDAMEFIPGGGPNRTDQFLGTMQTQFADLMPFQLPGFDEASFERFWGQYNALNDLFAGGAWHSTWLQVSQEIDAATPAIENSLDNLLGALTVKQQMVAQIAQVFAQAFTSMFSTAMTKGFAAGVKAFLGAMLQGIGMILAQWGAMLFAQGLMEVIFGTAPPPFGPRPDAIAHGGKAMAIGLAFMAGGGLMAGLGGALSGGGGGGSSASDTMGSAGTTRAQDIQPVVFDVNKREEQAPQQVNVTINAMDSQSFHDFMLKNGRDAVSQIATEDFRRDGSFRAMRRW